MKTSQVQSEFDQAKTPTESILSTLYEGLQDLIKELDQSIETGNTGKLERRASDLAHFFKEKGYATDTEGPWKIREDREKANKYLTLNNILDTQQRRLKEVQQEYNTLVETINAYKQTITGSNYFNPETVQQKLSDPHLSYAAREEFNKNLNDQTTTKVQKLFEQPKIMNLDERITQLNIGYLMKKELEKKQHEIVKEIEQTMKEQQKLGITEEEVKHITTQTQQFDQGFDSQHNTGKYLGMMHDLIINDFQKLLR